LAAEFSVAGRVVSANIITRGPRSLGYGFVEMESEEEAQKAVTLLNKKSVDQREINVELAKPRSETENRPQGERRSFRRRRGGRGFRGGLRRGPPSSTDPDKNSNNNNNNNQPSNNNQGGDNNNQQQQRGTNNQQRGGINQQAGINNNANNQGNQGRRSFRRYRGGRGGRGNINEGEHSKENEGQVGPPRERRPRSRFNRSRDLSNRTPSPTTLFVANLPFAMDDEAFLKLFKDHKVSKAHVVMNRNGRSKGFGFVEFENENDQKAALAASEKLTVDNRELIVKIALNAPERSKDSGVKEVSTTSAAPSPAPASSSSSAAAPVAAASSSAAASPVVAPSSSKETQVDTKNDEKSS